MGALSSVPSSRTPMRLARGKSYSFSVQFVTPVVGSTSTDFDLTGCQLQMTVRQPKRMGGAVVFTKAGILWDAEAGLGRFDLQADDLDIDIRSYPYSIVLVNDENYSAVVVQGDLEIVENTSDLGLGLVYDGDTVSQGLTAIVGADKVQVTVNSLAAPKFSTLVTEGVPGDRPQVWIEGFYPHQILHFRLPLGGPEGPQGIQGLQGLRGLPGPQGPAGPPSVVEGELVLRSDPGIPVYTVNSVRLPDGRVMEIAVLTGDDRLIEGYYEGKKVFTKVQIGDAVISASGVYDMGGGFLIGGTEPADAQLTELIVDKSGNIPSWVLARWAARMGGEVSPSVPIRIHGIGGQSNSTEDVGPFAPQLLTPTSAVVKWDSIGGAWNTDEMDPPWLGSGIARAWWERDARAVNLRVGTVPGGIGGTGFTELEIPAGSGVTYTWDHTNLAADVNMAIRFRDMLIAAKAAAPVDSEIDAIWWSQGEADRGHMNQAQYSDALDAFIDWIRDELGLPNLPFIIFPFTPLLRVLGNTNQTDTIYAALEDTPRRKENTAFVLRNVDDSQAGEYIHWSPDAQHRRGTVAVVDPDPTLPSAYDQALLNVDDAPRRSVPWLTVTRSGGVATMTWGHPAARVESFTLEVCTDGDGTLPGSWTVHALSGATVHKATKAVAAGTPLWARISAVCSTGTSYATVEVRA